MHIPKHFAISDTDEMFSFIQSNAFGQLISTVKGQLFSSHIPFLLSEDKSSLICHIARSNPQWNDIESQEVLITFQGPHDYISPSWYSTPGVPTWNYQAVHVYGTPKLIVNADIIKEVIEKLTAIYEAPNEKSWLPEYNESLLNVIVAIEIQITNIQCKYKLSQNRSLADQEQVIKELEKRGSNKLSQAMKNRL